MAKTKVAPQITEAVRKLLRETASEDQAIAKKAMRALAAALEMPIRQGILEADTLGDAYSQDVLAPGAQSNYPLDFVAPGTEADYVAFTMPGQARIPERHVEGDEVWVPTFETANAIDWSLKYGRDARWDVVGRATQVLIDGMAERRNDDGWHVLLASAASRGIVVTDVAAPADTFTLRLVNRLKTVNKRVAPGAGFTISDMYISPEAFEDIRDFDNTQIDEVTRREIFVSEDGGLARIYGVNLHELKKLGGGQAYNDYIVTTLGVALPGGDSEFAVGLDLTRRDSFVEPVRLEATVYEDELMHRSRRAGLYTFREAGFGALDNRRCALASM